VPTDDVEVQLAIEKSETLGRERASCNSMDEETARLREEALRCPPQLRQPHRPEASQWRCCCCCCCCCCLVVVSSFFVKEEEALPEAGV